MFDGKRTNVHNEESNALPSVVNVELKTKIVYRAEKQDNRDFTVGRLDSH